MKLATLLRRSAAAQPSTERYEATGAGDNASPDIADLRRMWDDLRQSAGSASEREEIDAMFSRVMP